MKKAAEQFSSNRPIYTGNRKAGAPDKFFTIVLLFFFVFGGTQIATAHEGPPFPILMDEPAAGYVVSVWADPDIGEAQFFVIIESPAGGPPETLPNVSIWVEPDSSRLQRVEYVAKRRSQRNQLQYEALPYFDQRDLWTVGFRIVASSGETHELTTQVESTPPGYGVWDLAIYLFPFILLGAMWMIAISKRQRSKRTNQSIASELACDPHH